MIKPLGVYGSKAEIVRLLQSIGAIDDNAYVPPIPSIYCYKISSQCALVTRSYRCQRFSINALIWFVHREGEFNGF